MGYQGQLAWDVLRAYAWARVRTHAGAQRVQRRGGAENETNGLLVAFAWHNKSFHKQARVICVAPAGAGSFHETLSKYGYS